MKPFDTQFSITADYDNYNYDNCFITTHCQNAGVDSFLC